MARAFGATTSALTRSLLSFVRAMAAILRTVNIYTKSPSRQASLLSFCTTGGPPSPGRGLAQAAQRGAGAAPEFAHFHNSLFSNYLTTIHPTSHRILN